MAHTDMSYEPSQHARPTGRWFVSGRALCAAMLLWLACTARAAEAQGQGAPHGLAPLVLFGVALMLVVAKLVDLRVVARPSLIGFARALTVAALLGKQVCGLAVTERRTKRLAIGVGMLPRGEVELVFAGVGATLMLTQADGTRAPVVSPATDGAIGAVVVITTLVTPPLLKWALTRKGATKETIKEER